MNESFFKSALMCTPALLGVLSVLQAGMNKKIAQAWGLPAAVWFNSMILFMAASLLLWLASQSKIETLQFQFRQDNFYWWFALPGILGLILVFGVPYSMQKWGAIHTFILFISAQLLTSVLWDLKVENISIPPMRYLGLVITWLGAIITIWKK